MAGHAAPYEVPADGADDDLDGTWSAGAGAAPAGVPPPHNILLIEDATDSARLSPPLLTPLPMPGQELQNTILDKVRTSIDATNRSPDTPASPATGDAEQSKLADAIICNHVDVVRDRFERRMDPNLTVNGKPPLHIAAHFGLGTMADLLLQYGASVRSAPVLYSWCFFLVLFSSHLPLRTASSADRLLQSHRSTSPSTTSSRF